MPRPSLAAGRARVQVVSRANVSRGVLAGKGLTWTHAKTLDGSSVSFDASPLEAAMVTDPAMLEDALAIVEVDLTGVWTKVATPYVLSPGSGTVVGLGEGGAREHSLTGVGALSLAGEWLVLHSGGQVNRRGPVDRYLGWQSTAFVDTGWATPTQVTAASLSITAAKYGEPEGWPLIAASANWVYRDVNSEGSLTLFRFGSFTVSTARKYVIGFSCDEEAKVYLDGPGYGGVIIESSEQETGYMIHNEWSGVLQPGTYSVAAEMTTVASAGGDGYDAARMYVATVDNKRVPNVLVLSSGAGTKVWRQHKTALRPGFTTGDLVMKLRTENITWGIPSASLLVPDFSATTDSAAVAWPTGQERVWSVGTPVAQVLADLEVDATFDASTTFALRAWTTRGTDLSGTVALTLGADPATTAMNVEGYGWTSDPVTGTRAMVLTNDGFVEVIDAPAETAADARGMFLESGASGSIARGVAYGLDAIRQSGRVRRAYMADVIAVAGAIPEVSFTVADTVSAPNYQRTMIALQVMSVAGSNNDAHVAFTVELAEKVADVTTFPATTAFPSDGTFPGA